MGRTGVQASWRDAALANGQVRSQASRRRYDELARKHGHADTPTLLTATDHLSAPPVGRMIGLTEPRVRKLRVAYGVRRPGD